MRIRMLEPTLCGYPLAHREPGYEYDERDGALAKNLIFRKRAEEVKEQPKPAPKPAIKKAVPRKPPGKAA